ncbi:IMP cyclohydrolase [Natronorarus salvus]|uniref:IMP cyclohydrolase n=1 Tax=Natronorarus salvus TaxID=3117733 RepID=UPI002F26852F
MYVGRFIVVAPDRAGYRVSSRSFPDRRVIDRDGTLTVAPTPGAAETDNPYVSYNCARFVSEGDPEAGPENAEAAVLGNGSQVDPIAEKLSMGYPARDALSTALLALDYEKDDYDTPRIAGVLDSEEGTPVATVGIVRRDALLVEAVEEPTLVATYERDTPEAFSLDATSSEGVASELYDHEFEHAVCAAGVERSESGFVTAIENGE